MNNFLFSQDWHHQVLLASNEPCDRILVYT
jgi:hypothetical protein